MHAPRPGRRMPVVIAVFFALALNLTDRDRSQAEPPDQPKAPGPRCDRVRFYPVTGGEAALVGGKFAGSNVSRTEGFETLAEIEEAPESGTWSELRFRNSKVYRWLRFEGAPGTRGKIAELEFYAGDRKLSGPGAGYGPVIRDAGRSWQARFDGNPRTFLEMDAADGGYVGIDLRDQATAHRPVFEPAPASAAANGAPAEIIDPLDVTIRSATPGASIRFTLDGTMPTAEHGMTYRGPIHLDATATIQAVALIEGQAASPSTAGTYLIKGSSQPGFRTFHWGNSLTQTTSMFASYARTAGRATRPPSSLGPAPGRRNSGISDSPRKRRGPTRSGTRCRGSIT